MLMKCPFCGSENVELLRFDVDMQEEVVIDDEDKLDGDGYCPYIHCVECSIDFLPHLATSTPIEVIKIWNRRYYGSGWIALNGNNIPDEEVLCCDRYGEMIIGYISKGEENFNAENDNEYMYDCVAYMYKPSPYKEDRS